MSFEQEALNIKKRAVDQLCLCYDPEISVNVVDLGLIYNISVKQKEDSQLQDACYIIYVLMTLTNAACGFSNFIISEIKHRLSLIEAVSAVDVELIFDPAWSRQMLSLEAQLFLGMI